MRLLLLKNWRDIKTRKGQFAALIVLVALGISVYVSFVSSYKNLTVSADRASNELKLADFSSKVVSAPAAVTDEIRNLPGVAAVEGRLIIDTALNLDEQTQTTARIIGVPADRHPAVNDIMVEDGRYFEGGTTAAGILQRKFSRDAEKTAGDTLMVRVDGREQEINIVGVGSSADYIWPIRAKGELPAPKEFAVIFMPQEEVERLFNREPSYNEISVLVAGGADRETVIKDVEAVLEPYQIEETLRQEDLPGNFALREEIRQNESLAYSMPLMILIISSLSLFIALSRLVQSQRGQIGLAKALGYGNFKILLHYLIFSMVIAISGAAVGFGLGHLLGQWITALYNGMLNLPFLENRVYPSVVIWSFVISLGSCVLAGIIPAWSSIRMTPANAMRVDPNLAISKGSIPLVEKALSRIIPASFTFRIPLRNIFRTRKRSAYTVIGIIFALILTISTWSMFDSFDSLIDKKFNQAEKWDVSAVFSGDVSQAQLSQISGWDGVSQIQGAQMIPSRIEAGNRQHEGIITAVSPDEDFHVFDITEGEDARAALAADGIILPTTIADKLNVKAGDELLVRTPYLREGRTVVLKAVSEEGWGAAIYTSTAEGEKLTGSAGQSSKLAGGAGLNNSAGNASEGAKLTDAATPGINALYLNINESAAPEVKKSLYGINGVEEVVVKDSLVKGIVDQLGFIYAFSGVLLGFAFTMAFVVIYNTFTANILERTREIATMRTIGEDNRHLALMITLENLFLALVGIPIGIIAGLWIANSLYSSLSTEVYTFRAVLYPLSYVWIILSIIAVLLISEIPPIRRIFKLDLAEATKLIE